MQIWLEDERVTFYLFAARTIGIEYWHGDAFPHGYNQLEWRFHLLPKQAVELLVVVK